MKNLEGYKRITFFPEKKAVPFQGAPSILEVAQEAGLPISFSCGGTGSCTTCLIRVLKGLDQLEPRGEIESERALERDFLPEERLACQTLAVDNLEVEIL